MTHGSSSFLPKWQSRFATSLPGTSSWDWRNRATFFKSLTPAAFKTLKGQQDTHGQLMRYRLLTLPVMVAVVLTLVNRRVNSWSELTHLLKNFREQKIFCDSSAWKAVYYLVKTLSQTQRYRDEIVKLGIYHYNSCHHPLRLVSVLWNGPWYNYLTNVRNPDILPAHLVVELYRRRWRVENVFAITKCLLGLSYFWDQDCNGVQVQIYMLPGFFIRFSIPFVLKWLLLSKNL